MTLRNKNVMVGKNEKFWGPLDINVGVNCRAILPPLSVTIWDRKVNMWMRRCVHKA